MNKQGSFVGLLVFMIFAVIIVMFSGIFIYMSRTVSTQLHEQLDNRSTSAVNYTSIMEETIDEVSPSYNVLKWGSFAIIIFMAFSIFISSYLVTTRPIFFVPYFIFVIICIIMAVVMTNVYEDLLEDATLGSILLEFSMSNVLLQNLPIVVTVVGFIGGIIMFASYYFSSQEVMNYG